MKKTFICLLAVFSLLATSAVVFAAGGFTERLPHGHPGGITATVSQALQMADDTDLVLQGYIVQHLGKKDYLFRDESGTITVKIDEDEWRDLTVSPADKIEIVGEVEHRRRGDIIIDVDYLRIL